jgi:hypothetical protein
VEWKRPNFSIALWIMGQEEEGGRGEKGRERGKGSVSGVEVERKGGR